MNEISQLRKEIDRLDKELVELLNARCSTSIAIGEYKKANGLPVYDKAREDALLKNLAEINSGPLPQSALSGIYAVLLEASRNLQK